MSPACRIASTPASACSASGRISPCVSEMTPTCGCEVSGLRSLAVLHSETPRPRDLSTPNGGFLRPDRVLVAVLERLRRGFERAGIVGSFVARNARPVHGLGCRLGSGEVFADVTELLLGLCELLSREQRLTQPELQLAEEFVGREEALDAVTLFLIRVDDQDRRRPVDAEALHSLRMFFDMQANRNEVVDDERADARLGVNLGFQPSTTASHRRGGEIEDQRLPRFFRLGQGLVDILGPLNGGFGCCWHGDLRMKRHAKSEPVTCGDPARWPTRTTGGSSAAFRDQQPYTSCRNRRSLPRSPARAS